MLSVKGVSMLLVDSSVWIDFFNGRKSKQTDYLDRILGKDLILVGDIILAEVLQGFRSDYDFEAAKNALSKFPQQTMLGHEIALKSAQNFRLLRKQGITIRKTIDCFIATYCIEAEIPILHADKDFDPFENYLGLQVVLLP